MRRLPSVYDTATRTANGIRSSPSNHQLPIANNPLSARLPVGSITDPLPTQAVPDSTIGQEAPAAVLGVDEPPPQSPTASIEQEPLQVPGHDGPQQPEESLVESSVLLQVSIVNRRSSENLPISLEHNDHSTLEYVQFTETASYRQYSFTSEHLAIQDGFLRRSTSGLRRMLSARSRFVAARSRSLLRRIQREVDIEMQNPDAAWQEHNNQQDELVELDATPAGTVLTSHSAVNFILLISYLRSIRGRSLTKSRKLGKMGCKSRIEPYVSLLNV